MLTSSRLPAARHIVQGTQAHIDTLLQQTQGGGPIDIACIERLTATYRPRFMARVRHDPALAHQGSGRSFADGRARGPGNERG
jgi:hypothetical protein